MCTLPRTREESWTLRDDHASSWGYDEDEFGYRLRDLIDKKVIQSREIIFMEKKTNSDW